MHIFQKFSSGLNTIIGSVQTEPQPHSQCFLRMELIKGLINFGKILICLQTNAIAPLSQLSQSFLSCLLLSLIFLQYS